MLIDLSPAEIGAIVSALELEYPSDSPEISLAIQLCSKVHETLGDDLYNQWCWEFDIVSG